MEKEQYVSCANSHLYLNRTLQQRLNNDFIFLRNKSGQDTVDFVPKQKCPTRFTIYWPVITLRFFLSWHVLLVPDYVTWLRKTILPHYPGLLPIPPDCSCSGFGFEIKLLKSR